MTYQLRKSLTILILMVALLTACAAPVASEMDNTSGGAVDESEVLEAVEESSVEADEVEEELSETQTEEIVEESTDADSVETEDTSETSAEAIGESVAEEPTDEQAVSGKINVYISPDSLGLALEEAFEAEHGDVLTIVGGSWCRKVKSEQEAGDIQADVICGAEPVFYNGLAQSGALLSYTSPNIDNLKTDLQWDNGYYLPTSLSYIGIVYNNTMVDEADLPQTFSDLNDAKWDSLTAVPDATQCASSMAIAAAFAQPDLDMSFYQAAKGNHALLADRAVKVPEMVASGEAVLGVGPHDPVVRLQNKAKKEGVESPVSIAWSEDGAYAISRPVAIIADENRSEEDTVVAQAFVDFILSEKGQTIIVKKVGYVPAAEGIEGPALVPSDLELMDIDWDWAMQNSKDIQEAFQAVMYGSN